MVRVREGLLQLEDMPVLARRGGGDDSGSAHPFEHALDHSPRMEHDNSRDQPHRRQFSVELVGGAAQPHPDAHGQAEEMGGEVLGRNGAHTKIDANCNQNELRKRVAHLEKNKNFNKTICGNRLTLVISNVLSPSD